MQQRFDGRWAQLEADRAADMINWGRRVEEGELRCRRQRDQLAGLNNELTEARNRLRRSEERVARLSDELDFAHQEANERESRVDELKEDLRKNRSARSEALGRVQTLELELTRREEQMSKMNLEFQGRLTAFGEEMALRHRRNSELEGQLADATARAVSAVEEYKKSAEFEEERRAACADAFRFGEEEARSRISRAYPDLDLSCLDADCYETRTPGAEEDEYEEISDVDLESILGVDAAAEAPGKSIFEKGESSSAPADAATASGAEPDPNP